jgi:hypothetical protein
MPISTPLASHRPIELHARRQLALALRQRVDRPPSLSIFMPCPVSLSGSLNTTEVYRDSRKRDLGYLLPTYGLALEDGTGRIAARLELTPGLPQAGRLRVRLGGHLNRPPAPVLAGQVRFDRLPDGTPITAGILVARDIFLASHGFEVAGAPQNEYCAGATAASVVPANVYGTRVPVLTSASPGDVFRCNGVPLEFSFHEPVASVAVRFLGATRLYTLKAFDPQGALLGQRVATPASVSEDCEVHFSVPEGGSISRVVFGHLPGAALTLITELSYQRFPPPDQPTEYHAVPHTVALSLRYLAAENIPDPGRMSTWKTVAFDEVLADGRSRIDAVANLRTLAELDAVHRALSGPWARARWLLHCEADLAVPTAVDLSELIPGGPLHPHRPRPADPIESPAPSDPAPRPPAHLPPTRMPAYTIVRASCDQWQDFFFDPNDHPYIFPPRTPGSGSSLVRFAVAPDQPIFQDTAERHVFYFLPDEFRLTRDDERAPTYRPSLQLAFTVDESRPPVDDDPSYRVQLSFRAVPYLEPSRESDARRFIYDNGLIPDGRPAALLPLAPEWSELTVTLPNEGASGVHSEARPAATVVFDKYVMDTLDLSPDVFTEVFHSMQAGRDTFAGKVRYRLPGADTEHAIPLSGRLDKLAGPTLEAELLTPTPDGEGRYRVRLTNGIESPVTLEQAAIYLLEDPETGKRTLAPVVASPFPLELAAAKSAEIDVRPAALAQAFGARVVPTQMQVHLDFAELWRSILDQPGWEGLIRPVKVDVDPGCFDRPDDPHPIHLVRVRFNSDELVVELTANRLSAEVKLVRPLLAYLLEKASADVYTFRVESWHRNREGDLVLVGTSALLDDRMPTLTVSPPRA